MATEADLAVIISGKNDAGPALLQLQSQIRDLQAASGGLARALGPMHEGTARAGAIAAEAGRGVEGLGESMLKLGGMAGLSESMLGSWSSMIGQFAPAALGIAGIAAAGEALKGSVETTEQFGHAVLALQSEIGGSAEQASTLLATFQRYNISADQAGATLGIFSKHLMGVEDAAGDATTGGKSFDQAMQSLGISSRDSSGSLRPMSDILLNVSDRFQGMPDGIEKTNDSMALFGRSGRDLILMLNQGSVALQENMATAQRYGLQLSGENIEAIHAYGMAQKDMEQAQTGLALQTGQVLIPALTRVDQSLAEMTASMLKGGDSTSLFGASIKPYADAFKELGTIYSFLVPASANLSDATHIYAGQLSTLSGQAESATGSLASVTGQVGAAAETMKQAATEGQNLAKAIGASDDAFMRHPGLDSYSDKLAQMRLDQEKLDLIAQGQALAQSLTNTPGGGDLFTRHTSDALAAAAGGERLDPEEEKARQEKAAKDTKDKADKDIADAKKAVEEAKREADKQFAEHQAAQQQQLGNAGLAQQISGYDQTQEQIAQQAILSSLQEKRSDDQAKNLTASLRGDDLRIAQQQNHMKFLSDKAANERDLFTQQQARAEAEIELAKANRDGTAEEVAAVKAKIALIDQYLGKIQAVGNALKEETAKDKTKAGAQEMLAAGSRRNNPLTGRPEVLTLWGGWQAEGANIYQRPASGFLGGSDSSGQMYTASIPGGPSLAPHDGNKPSVHVQQATVTVAVSGGDPKAVVAAIMGAFQSAAQTATAGA